MRQNFRIGRIGGIEIGANWSLLVVFWLIAWTLASARFPRNFPGYSEAWYWVAGIGTATIFFASLLAHELAHSFLARRYGIKVDNITLWLFGGVARLRTEAAGPQAEMKIAAVGPATSLALAAGFAALAAGLSTAPLPDLVRGTVGWLALINAVLAVFNFVPAFPLDGGRVLRGFLWRTRDRTEATRIAATAGRAFAYLLIGVGIAEFFLAAALGGLWFFLLGWFLLMAARAEEVQTMLHDALSRVRVEDVMSPNPLVAPDSVDVEKFIEDYAKTHRFSTFPLRSDGEISGMATIARLKDVPREQRSTTAVGQIACSMDEVATARPNEPAVRLIERMRECPDGRSLVFEDGELVGIVSPSDIQKALQRAGVKPSMFESRS